MARVTISMVLSEKGEESKKVQTESVGGIICQQFDLEKSVSVRAKGVSAEINSLDELRALAERFVKKYGPKSLSNRKRKPIAPFLHYLTKLA